MASPLTPYEKHMQKLRERHGMEGLELDHASDRAAAIQTDLQTYADEVERVNAKNVKMILALGKTVYQGQPMNIWLDVIPSR
jgi:hypothetical protein